MGFSLQANPLRAPLDMRPSRLGSMVLWPPYGLVRYGILAPLAGSRPTEGAAHGGGYSGVSGAGGHQDMRLIR